MLNPTSLCYDCEEHFPWNSDSIHSSQAIAKREANSFPTLRLQDIPSKSKDKCAHQTIRAHLRSSTAETLRSFACRARLPEATVGLRAHTKNAVKTKHEQDSYPQ
jgi:hypothetical protein